MQFFKSTISTITGAGALLLACISIPVMYAAGSELETQDAQETAIVHKVVVANGSSQDGAVDIEAIRAKVLEKLGPERSAEVLAAVEPLLNKLQSADYSSMSSEELQDMLGSNSDAKVRVFKHDVNVDIDAEGDAATSTSAKVIMRTIGEDGEVVEQVMEGDEAMQFIGGEGGLATHLENAHGIDSDVQVKVMQFKNEDGDISKLLKFETAVSGAAQCADAHKLLESLELDLENLENLENLEVDAENVVIMQRGETDGVTEVRSTDENGQIKIVRTQISDDVDQQIAELLAAGGKIHTNIDGDQQNVKVKVLRINKDDMDIDVDAEPAELMSWTSEDGNIAVSNSKRIMVFIDAQKLSPEGETGISPEAVEQAIVEAEVIIVSDEDVDAETSQTQNSGRQDEAQNQNAKQAPFQNPQANDNSGLQLDGFNVYPNPSDGRFNLEFNLPQAGSTSVKIIDIQGREVFREDFESSANQLFARPIDLSGGAAGTYLLSVTQNGATATKKIEVR